MTDRVFSCSHVELSQAPHGPHAPVSQTPSLGLLPVQGCVSVESGLVPAQAVPHGQLTVRVRVCSPITPQAVALQSLQALHAPVCQAGLGQALVCVAAGLLDAAQAAPPQAPGAQVTERLLLRLQIEPLHALHDPHAPVSQTPSLGLLPVQDRVSVEVGAVPAQAVPHGQLTVRVRVCWPAAPQAVALQALQAPHAPVCQAGLGQALVCVAAGLLDSSQAAPPHAPGAQVTERLLLRSQIEPLHALHDPHAPVSQTPSRASPPAQARDDGPEQLPPPHPGAGLSQVRVCVPAAPQALAEQALQADQPPSTAAAPVQPRVSLAPLVPSSFRHCRPSCAGTGSLQVRVWVPAAPQAVAEQALQSDQPPSTAVNLLHFSESAPPNWPSQRHTYTVG